MRQMMELPDLAAEIQRQAASKADYVTDTRRMNVQSMSNGHQTTTLIVDGASDDGGVGEYDLTDHAHGQVAGRLKIPKKYYDRMRVEAPELLDRNITHWFHEEPERRMIRTLDGKARAFLSDRYRPRDNVQIAEYLLPYLAEIPGAKIESCGLTETKLYIKAVLPNVKTTIEGSRKVGDEVCSGVVISNSEVGAGAFNVETLIYRLWCLNGAITGTALSKYHVGGRVGTGGEDDVLRVFADDTIKADDEAFFLAARDVVKAACSEIAFREIVKDCEALTSLRVDHDPVAATERLANDYDLNDNERASILSHLVEGGDLSAWGYVNAVTRASQDVDDYDRATELERLGGTLIGVPETAWTRLLRAA